MARLHAVERRAGTRGPYERPRLSKDYLRGEAGRERVYVHGEGFYADHDIELHLGRTAVDMNTTLQEIALDVMPQQDDGIPVAEPSARKERIMSSPNGVGSDAPPTNPTPGIQRLLFVSDAAVADVDELPPAGCGCAW